MKKIIRMTVAVLLFAIVALTWTACSSDGYSGSSTVYVSHGYHGYGPGWGHGWGGYRGGYYPPPVVIGPPVVIHH